MKMSECGFREIQHANDAHMEWRFCKVRKERVCVKVCSDGRIVRCVWQQIRWEDCNKDPKCMVQKREEPQRWTII